MQRLTNEQGPVQEVPTPSQAADDLESRLREMALRLAQAQDQQKREILRLRAQEALARAEVAARYENSMSWRLTAPLRLAAQRGMARGLARGLVNMLRHGRGAGGGVRPATGGSVAGRGTGRPGEAADARAAMRAQLTGALRAFLAGSGGTLRLPSSPEPEVSILLVLYNQAELTYGCLTSIAACLGNSGVPAEVVIHDNGSTDLTYDLLARVEGARLLLAGENLHFLHGANRAAAEARGRHLLMLNNDAQLLPGTVEAALRTLAEVPRAGAVGGRIILPDGTLQEAGSTVWRDGSSTGYMRGADPAVPEAMFRRDVDYCSGAFLLTPREVWERLGGLDERYAPAYYEETDYCVRLWEAGLRVVFDPDVAVLHYEFGSSPSSEAAIALQRSHRAIFRDLHAGWLERRPPPGQELEGRTAGGGGGPRILVVDDRVPHRELGSGFPRAADLIAELAAAGAQVTLFPMVEVEETWPRVRRSLPLEVEVMLGASAGGLVRHLKERRGFYDAVMVSRPHNMRAFRAITQAELGLVAGAAIIYDAEAVFTLRDELRRALDGHPMSAEEKQRALAEEVALARGAHAVLCVSAEEKAAYEAHGAGPVQVVGHALEPAPDPTPFAERDGFLFVGAMHEDTAPNADSLRWFAQDVLPRLRAELGRDALRLPVAGIVAAPSVLALDGTALDLLGMVEDLLPLYARARVVVVPTRFAAGIPHKAHQAAALGVPMVTTDLIVRQLGWAPGRDLLAASDPAAFARACARLHSDEALWHAVREAALERLREDCSRATFRGAVHASLVTAGLADTSRTRRLGG